jgi:hypothetical protein
MVDISESGKNLNDVEDGFAPVKGSIDKDTTSAIWSGLDGKERLGGRVFDGIHHRLPASQGSSTIGSGGTTAGRILISSPVMRVGRS